MLPYRACVGSGENGIRHRDVGPAAFTRRDELVFMVLSPLHYERLTRSERG